MWIRRAFFSWLFPAALVLPLWLFIGWGVFQAGGWAFLWVLFVALPSVLVGEVVLALLVRARPTVRGERAVSWRDVIGFTVWHGLTIALGLFLKDAFGWVLTATIVAFLALFWSTMQQLWRESTSSLRSAMGAARADVEDGVAPDRRVPSGPRRDDVIVIAESPADPGGSRG